MSEDAGSEAEQPASRKRRLLIDATPLRRSRDLRWLVGGQLVSVLGTQLTTVAVPYQVYQLTGSSLVVGLLGTVQLVPLVLFGLWGGAYADAMDRRRLLIGAELLLTLLSGGLALNAHLAHPSITAIFTLTGDNKMQLAGYYKLPAPQTTAENCVAHNGSLIPVGEAIRSTGTTDLIASWINHASAALPIPMTLAMLLVITMLLTPLVHHAAAVIVMGPVAVAIAKQLGINGDPLLIAVAVGASCDFLSPIGHQCNTLVMGPGGYRFGDYWHLGLPLSILVVLLGTPLILAVWPLH